MAGKIVVGVNQTNPPHTALDWALRRAGQLNVPVMLTHVINDYPNLYDYGYYERERDSSKALLEKLTAHAHETAPGVAVSTQSLTGPVTKTLSEVSSDAGLLVVGTDKTNRFVSEVFSGVGLQLAAVSQCPLAVIPRSADEAGTGVVVGVDGSDGSRSALDFAAAEANRTGQDLTAVYAYHVPEPWMRDNAAEGTVGHKVQLQAQSLLAESVAGISELYPDLRIHHKVMTDPPPAKALIIAADSAHMLVVGNRGRGRLKSLLLGSVSHDLLAHPPCPTVVTHQRRHSPAGSEPDIAG